MPELRTGSRVRFTGPDAENTDAKNTAAETPHAETSDANTPNVSTPGAKTPYDTAQNYRAQGPDMNIRNNIVDSDSDSNSNSNSNSDYRDGALGTDATSQSGAAGYTVGDRLTPLERHKLTCGCDVPQYHDPDYMAELKE